MREWAIAIVGWFALLTVTVWTIVAVIRSAKESKHG